MKKTDAERMVSKYEEDNSQRMLGEVLVWMVIIAACIAIACCVRI